MAIEKKDDAWRVVELDVNDETLIMDIASGKAIARSYAAIDVGAFRYLVNCANLGRALTMRDDDFNCTCAEIMAKDHTRHFRGCPLREKYPTHEAEKCGTTWAMLGETLVCSKPKGHDGAHRAKGKHTVTSWPQEEMAEDPNSFRSELTRHRELVGRSLRGATEDAVRFLLKNAHAPGDTNWSADDARAAKDSIFQLTQDAAAILARVEQLEDLPRRIIQGELPDDEYRKRVDNLSDSLSVFDRTFNSRLVDCHGRISKLEEETPNKILRSEHEMIVSRLEKIEAHAMSQHTSPQAVTGSFADLDVRIEKIEFRASMNEKETNEHLKQLEAADFANDKMFSEHAGRLDRLEHMLPTGRMLEIQTRLDGHQEWLKQIDANKLPLRIKTLEARSNALNAWTEGISMSWLRERVLKLEAGATDHVAALHCRQLEVRVEKLEKANQEFQPWHIPESPMGLLKRIAKLEAAPSGMTRLESTELYRRIDAIDNSAHVLTSRIEKLEEYAVSSGPRVDSPPFKSQAQSDLEERGFERVSRPDPRLKFAVERGIPFEEHKYRPKIVCLCGSTKFAAAFADANLRETLAGNIVLTVGSMMHSDADINVCVRCKSIDGEGPCTSATGMHVPLPLTEPRHIETKNALDELHKRKIDLADEVFVLNVETCRLCKRTFPEITRTGICGVQPTHLIEPYIGESTRGEIAHALKSGKPIRFLRPQGKNGIGCIKDSARRSDDEVKWIMHDLGLGVSP